VLLTGWGGQLEEKEKIFEAGVDGIVEKPVDIQELLQLLRTLVPRGA
jgi:DNA-binding response OmpR family regulator